MNWRSWLRKTPAPVRVLVGATQLAVVESRTKWADVEQSLLSLARDGDTISAVGEDGAVLRSLVYNADSVEEPEEAPPPKEANADFLVALARELNAAYTAGATQHAAAYQLAFGKMVDLTELLANRLTAMEERWAKAQIANARMLGDLMRSEAAAEQSADPHGIAGIIPVIDAAMDAHAKKSAASAATPPPPSTNGKR